MKNHQECIVRLSSSLAMFVIAVFVDGTHAVAVDTTSDADLLQALGGSGGNDSRRVARKLKQRAKEPIDDNLADIEGASSTGNHRIDGVTGFFRNLRTDI